MNLDTITSAFRGLVMTPELRAIVVDGPWGAGKTYFAKKFAADHATLLKRHELRFAYVSLFSATSLAEVRSRMCLAGEGWRKAATRIKPPSAAAGWNWGNIAEVAKEMIEDHFLRNLFVCIDDVERAGPSVSLGEVLGLVSEVTQERGCKCVVLLNSEHLERREMLKTYAEKVFDLEIAFRPFPADVIQFGLPNPMAAKHALPVFERAECANIRVMQRTNWVLREIELIDEKELVRHQWPRIVAQVATLCICHYGHRHLFGGSLESLLDWSLVSYRIRSALPSHENKLSTKDPGKELLEKLQYERQPYDEAIIRMLQTGFLRRETMTSGLRESAANAAQDERDARYGELWDQLSDNFCVTHGQFLGTLREYLAKSGCWLRDGELLTLCNLLLELQNDEPNRRLAFQSLVRVVEKVPAKDRHRVYSKHKKLLSTRIFNRIPHKPTEEEEPISRLFYHLTSSDSFDPTEFRKFARFSSQEIAAFLLGYRDTQLFRRIDEFFRRLDAADEALRYPLQQRMNAALKAVAKLDQLHRFRINWIAREARTKQKRLMSAGGPNSAARQM